MVKANKTGPKICVGQAFYSMLGSCAILHCWVHGMHTATFRVEHSAQVYSCLEKFVHGLFVREVIRKIP
jgi:hypothetical protein